LHRIADIRFFAVCASHVLSMTFAANRHVAFINDSPHLVATTDTTLYVWNLLSLSVWWSYTLPVVGLCADPASSRFAVIAHAATDAPAGDAADGEFALSLAYVRDGSHLWMIAVMISAKPPAPKMHNALLVFDISSP